MDDVDLGRELDEGTVRDLGRCCGVEGVACCSTARLAVAAAAATAEGPGDSGAETLRGRCPIISGLAAALR